MTNENQLEEMLRQLVLEMDFEEPKNQSIVNAMVETVFQSSVNGTAWKRFLNKGKYLFLALIGILTVSYFLLNTNSKETVYTPVKIKEDRFNANTLDVMQELDVQPYVIEQFSIPQKQPRITKRLLPILMDTLVNLEDEMKVFRPDRSSELPAFTDKQKQTHKEEKEKYLKRILKLDKKLLIQVPIEEEYSTKISDFAMWVGELTNQEYQLFLNDLAISGRKDDYQASIVHSEGWYSVANDSTSIEPMIQLYFTHPAYKKYPVVNVPIEGAILFCEWISEEIQKAGKNKNLLKKADLPTKEQWEYVASTAYKHRNYPWGGPFLRNKKGCFLANYKPKNNAFADGAIFPSIAISYAPSDFGVYNLSGNVSELVIYAEDHDQIGIKGGSWNDPAEYLKIFKDSIPPSSLMPHPTIGFRPIIHLKGRIIGVLQQAE